MQLGGWDPHLEYLAGNWLRVELFRSLNCCLERILTACVQLQFVVCSDKEHFFDPAGKTQTISMVRVGNTRIFRSGQKLHRVAYFEL